MNPRAFLELARRLLVSEPNPAGFRSTVSRAYYAAFNVASEFLRGMDCEVQEDAKGHKQAYFRLNNSGDPLLSQIASYLDDLRSERNVADYRLGMPHVEQEGVVRTWLEMASRIITELDTCNATDQRKSNAKTAIKEYMKKNPS
jgi:hypothetical protein